MPSSSSTSPSSSTAPKLLEVEQKFAFSDRSNLEERLRQQGFVLVKELTMVDWYFDRFVDDEVRDLDLPLIQQDHWLRYREIMTEDRNGNANANSNSNSNGGEWQLKRGNKGVGGGGATIYEEIEGIRAVKIARSVLREQPMPSSTSTDAEGEMSNQSPVVAFDGHTIPELPLPDCDVLPFARIVTNRSKWKQDRPPTKGGSSTDYANLVVDLDTTPDGFAVGEVEAVVEGENCENDDVSAGDVDEPSGATARNDAAVARAQADIREFLAVLLAETDDTNNQRPPMGKLEQFLFRKRPRMYEACVEMGIIPAR